MLRKKNKPIDYKTFVRERAWIALPKLLSFAPNYWLRTMAGAFLFVSFIAVHATATEGDVNLAQTPAPTRHPAFAIPGMAEKEFPQFLVPGQEESMQRLRELFYLHYRHAVRPKGQATFALAWLPKSTLWASPSKSVMGENWQSAVETWKQILTDRRIDSEGYVSCHQHRGLGLSEGWPFPLWTQIGGIGWHFSVKGLGYAKNPASGIVPITSVDAWKLQGGEAGEIDPDKGWQIVLNDPNATVTTPPCKVRHEVAPYVRVEWQIDTPHMQPYLEWTTDKETEFSEERRIHFDPPAKGQMEFSEIPVHEHDEWRGTITQMRIGFGNQANKSVTLREIITCVDTRHNVNNALYLQACHDLINWSGDLTFVREQISRMRLALRYIVHEFHTREHHHVFTNWPGHDGRSGIEISPEGKKVFFPGRGVGGNYFDILPFGGHDALATLYLYDVLRRAAELERLIAAHPEWNIPAPNDQFTSNAISLHAEEIKNDAGQFFWSPQKGRFVGAIDVDGHAHDFGFTFLNLEAIYYGFTTPDQSRSIIDWLTGDRIVESDTSQGSDIYRWRFGPRCTTRRNISYYQSIWKTPESIPWGYQIQDGGAVLGFSYFDLMARLKVLGPDNAWKRLQELIAWFDEVESAGGYRKYYVQHERGTLQGCNTPGGIGVDCEFFESVLAPQVMLYGFLGFRPGLEAFSLNPQLPTNWPELRITDIHYHGHVIDILATKNRLRITATRKGLGTLRCQPGIGKWELQIMNAGGREAMRPTEYTLMSKHDSIPLDFSAGSIVVLQRVL